MAKLIYGFFIYEFLGYSYYIFIEVFIMFSPEEMDTIPMSQLVLMAGADWDTSDDSADDYIEACIMQNTANQIAYELEDLDRLFVIYHDKSMINNYNRLLRELKQIRMHLNGY